MTAATLTPPAPAQPAQPAGASDWARALLERQLWILGQLAEGGLEIARAIERQATGEGSGEAAPHAVDAHIPMAYARVARAVRMTILLQSKLIGELQTLESKAAYDAARAKSRQAFERPGLVHAQKARLERIVRRIAWADGQDADEVDRLGQDAAELLDCDDHYGDILTRPVSELIALICQDLGLEPDWPALAKQAWAKAELEAGRAGGPLEAWVSAASVKDRPPANDPAPLKPQAASP
jgi:hypothetical protein